MITKFKDFLNEENDYYEEVTLYANEYGNSGKLSQKHVENTNKITSSLKNKTKVKFQYIYVTENGTETKILVNGTLIPDSDNPNLININLHSNYAKNNANYEGKTTIKDALNIINNFAIDSAKSFIEK